MESIILGFSLIAITGAIFFLKHKLGEIRQENKILKAKAEEENQKLTVLYNITQAVAQNENEAEIIKIILAEMAELGWDKSALWLMGKGLSLKLAYSHGFSKECLNLAQRQAISVKEVNEEAFSLNEQSEVEKDPLAKMNKLRSILVVPLAEKKKIKGVLKIYAAEENRFGDFEINYFLVVSKFLSKVL
jgi:LytS/YehU family sensor histidine kinase